MALKELGIEYKKIDQLFVAISSFKGEIEDIIPKIDTFYNNFKLDESGPPIAIIDHGVYTTGGKYIELCFPFNPKNAMVDIPTKYIDMIEALSIMHQGPIENLNETFKIILNYMQERLISGTAYLRLVFHKYNLKNPEENQIEIQYQLHKWGDRLKKGMDKVLGESMTNEILKDRENLFTIESSQNDRIQWLKAMLDRLDAISNEQQHYDILSCCAHEFSKKRVEHMRDIYEKTGDIDKVIEEMYLDNDWYEKPIRNGNILYVTKVPVDPEGYEKAQSLEEKKKSYCHCRFINTNFDKEISPTFCYCGTGWYRQIWEGILEKPIKVSVLKSLLKGDDCCELAIHLP